MGHSKRFLVQWIQDHSLSIFLYIHIFYYVPLLQWQKMTKIVSVGPDDSPGSFPDDVAIWWVLEHLSVVRQVSIQRHCDLDCEWVGGFLSSLSLVKRSIRVLLQAAYSRTRQMVPRNEKRPPWTPCGNSLWVVTEGKMAERELHLHQLAWADCASSGVSQTWVNLRSATY